MYMCINMAYRYLQTTNYFYIYYHIWVLSCRSKDYERKTNKHKERQKLLVGGMPQQRRINEVQWAVAAPKAIQNPAMQQRERGGRSKTYLKQTKQLKN